MHDLYVNLPSISPHAYCAGDPVNLTDPTGMNPVYNRKGEYLGCTEEGFTGDILLYYGEEEFDFPKFSQATLEGKFPDLFETLYYGNINIDGEGLSNIWTHVVSHFEGMKIFDERFSLDNIENKKISFRQKLKHKKSAWETWYPEDESIYFIYGNNTFTYESTVENLASSLIVHEWYSHSRKKI